MDQLLSVILFGEGFFTGLMLTLMLGPVTMIILRNGLQTNHIAGVWAAAGTWASDLVFINATYWMTTNIEQWTKQPSVRLSLFLVGGCGLLLMGLVMVKMSKRKLDEELKVTSYGYTRAFISGFVVNTLSPFTLFFWLGAAVFLHLQSGNPLWYYAGLLSALVIGDTTKAWLSPKLVHWLKEKHVHWVQMASGFLIAGSGLYIILTGILE